MNHFQVVDPAQYLQILADYLTMAPSLKVSSTHPLSRPVLRHPDLTPNNILISDTDEIVGLIDWQFAVVLPLCLTAGIPNSFQNWGDPVSESMRPPEMKLPPDLDQLPLEEQNRTRAVHRKRLVHFFYAGNTMMQIPEHYEALAQQKARLRARLYNLAGAPWEGDSVSLRHFLATATQEWPLAMPCPGELSDGSEASCPLTYTTEYMQQSADDYQVQEERLQELQEMREYLDIDRQGWVPDDAHWMKSKEMAKTIKTGLIKLAETNEEKTDALDHFPLDDHEE